MFRFNLSCVTLLTLAFAINQSSVAAPAEQAAERAKYQAAVRAFWTPKRQAAATPRDLYIDENGQGLIRAANGRLAPYGHSVAQGMPIPQAKPDRPGGGNGNPGGGGGDGSTSGGPSISDMTPGVGGIIIGSSATFSAKVTDPDGVKNVTFEVATETGAWQSFTAGATGSTYSAQLQNFTPGNWKWRISARDRSKKGGQLTTSDVIIFTVEAGGGSGGDGVITNQRWSGDGPIQTAAGRILFTMDGSNYVCSGTLVEDSASDRSILLTAAHCVYDDVAKAFATYAMFIPNQDGTTGSRTDTNCDNDPEGCWVVEFGVVESSWTQHTFPDNIPWDYGYYVVQTQTDGIASGLLDNSLTPMRMSFTGPATGDYSHALGYSYSDDPFFMFCAEAMTTEGSFNWWLPSCDLSGGSSGGPWTQSTETNLGVGPIISVNSWGYTRGSGMAGPFLNGTSAQCLFNAAQDQNTTEYGIVVAPANC